MTMHREVELEKRMKMLGRDRAQRMVNRAADAGAFSTVAGGNTLLQRVVLPLAEGITGFLQETGEPQAHALAAPILAQVDAVTSAYLTASTVIDWLPKDPAVVDVCIAVGARLEDEVRFGQLKAEAPGLWAVLQESFKNARSQSETYRRRVLAHYAKAKELEWRAWTKTERVHLGARLLDLLIASTGMVEVTRVWTNTSLKSKSAPKSVNRVRATQVALDIIQEVNAQVAARPHYMPTLVPPKPWTSPKKGDGGYHFINRALVKEYSRAFQEELAATEMPAVLRAVNAIQETAWRVNRNVLDVVLAIWDSSHDVEYQGVAPLRPRAVLEELPPIDAAAPLEGEELKEAKRSRAEIHVRNIERRRHTIAAANTIRMAVEYADVDAFFYPQQLDFRGRCYSLPANMTPQGDDLAKGLLTFADAVPLGDSGVEWLAIHGANSFGIDKVPFEERIEWVGAHERMILACAADPLGNREWMAADSPFVFLAFCFEWAAAMDSGDAAAFESSLPVGVDGSCNGLQHFSAMLRDPVGGAAVNLVPDTTPHDVYGEVLAAVRFRLEMLAAETPAQNPDDEHHLRAKAWLASGLLVRDLVKRPTMTLPYGCTRKGIEGQIMDDVVRPALAGGQASFPDDASGWRHVSWLAGIVWECMGEVVIAARVAMAWLQDVAAEVAGTGEPMVWRTPAGFPVRHFEVRRKTVTVTTSVGGVRLKITLREPTSKVDTGAMRLGVSPHFVHALDATHLYLTVGAALDLGVEAFAMVHDSYGTHAAHVALLGEILRDTFVRLYTDHHPLAELAAELAAKGIEVPPLPAMGELDLEQVRRSPFFFA